MEQDELNRIGFPPMESMLIFRSAVIGRNDVVVHGDRVFIGLGVDMQDLHDIIFRENLTKADRRFLESVKVKA